MSDRIEQMCFIAFGDSQVKKLVDEFYNAEKEEKDWDFYEEKFVKFFTDHIAYKINNANEILKQLKSYYVDFEVKFEVIENKIGQLEKRIENFRTFESKVSKATQPQTQSDLIISFAKKSKRRNTDFGTSNN